MGRYFGTDGFRGEANVNLTADHAYKVGRFLGWYYGELKRQAGLTTQIPSALIYLLYGKYGDSIKSELSNYPDNLLDNVVTS